MSYQHVKANLAQARADIQKAAQQVGRAADSVCLIAVSKLHPLQAVEAAAASGQLEFGENHVQEMVAKHAERPDLHWHMIGTLQRNKVKYIAGFVHLIHSVDSEKLLQEIDKQGKKAHRVVPCLLQINISDESQKGGFSEEEAAQLLEKIHEFPWVEVKGLMGMAALTENADIIRNQFKRLRQAFDDFASMPQKTFSMSVLSMGMSGDFKLAIAEGATHVRIGSSIFGQRNPTTL
jgi:pyridoxal phosphate enzyme (YggS family)